MTEPLQPAILWDNDGVLVETEALYMEASQIALQTIGVTLSHDEFVDISLTQGRSLLVWALEEYELGDMHGLDELRRIRNAAYHALLAEHPPQAKPGILDTLEFWQGKVAMGIVTSCMRRDFEAIHRKSGLLDYMDFVLVREDYGKSKPDPEPYRTALELYGLDAARSIVFEDSPRGVRSAKQAGLYVAGVCGPYTSARELHESNETCNTETTLAVANAFFEEVLDGREHP